MSNMTVTQEDVDKCIVEVQTERIDLVGKDHTIVAVRLSNGFTIIEVQTCVDPENFNMETGKEICMKKIQDKIWMLLGFELQTYLHSLVG